MFEEAELICAYTRAQAVRDGVLIDRFRRGCHICNSRARVSWPVAASHTITVQSALAEANRLPGNLSMTQHGRGSAPGAGSRKSAVACQELLRIAPQRASYLTWFVLSPFFGLRVSSPS
jgi:hypothetical protein